MVRVLLCVRVFRGLISPNLLTTKFTEYTEGTEKIDSEKPLGSWTYGCTEHRILGTKNADCLLCGGGSLRISPVNFNEAENYLLSLGNEVTAMKLGLENVSRLFAELGDPQKSYLKVQVAGTNGKGSVCAFLNSICVTAGIRTGMYTSPHLISITERIQIDGVEIGEEEFARLATLVRKASETLVTRGELETVPTFFEQVTAIALVAFAEAKVELAILETGLGGRLDATTAANAEIAAITRIDIDHQQYLGDTIEEIAAEKAAIIDDEFDKVVIGAQVPEALEVILARCRELGTVPVNQRYPPWTIESVGPVNVRVNTTLHIFPNVTLGLAGKHQLENAETAINVIQSLHYDFGISIDDHDIIDGLAHARHPGRLESFGRFLLDGAHNIGGARALAEYLDEFVTGPITMVFGSLNDKQTADIGAILFRKATRLVLTAPANSRAISPEDLLKFVPDRLSRQQVFVAPNVYTALEKALAVTGKRHVIVVTGSLYLVGEARRFLTGVSP